jgi:hypothetical protein
MFYYSFLVGCDLAIFVKTLHSLMEVSPSWEATNFAALKNAIVEVLLDYNNVNGVFYVVCAEIL